MHHVIIGNGIAGVTAARYVRARDPAARLTLVSDESPVHLARTAFMYVYMGQLTPAQLRPYADAFWSESRIACLHARAEGVDTGARRVYLAGQPPLAYDRLLVATGSVPDVPPWPGRDRPGVQGFYHLQDLERMEAATRGARRAVVVGGGLIGVELAEMLRVRGLAVTMLVREARYLPRVFPEDEAARVAAEIRRHGVDLRFGTEVARVEAGPGGRGLVVVTKQGEALPADFVGVGTGVRPNVGWLAGSGLAVRRGVLVDACLRASAPGVFAAGDCAEHRVPPPGRPAVEALWYTGRIQGATAAFGLLGTPRPYRPGVFFNAARFFDLEWQTYGRVDPVPRGGEAALVRADARRLLRIQHERGPEGAVVGVHGLNVRLRQETCTRWIAERWPLGRALADLPAARFDAEFTPALR
ncbi:MAG: NAD(P)/FAD-dependent oxidoreductase [Rubricoccaceae bacterium]